MARKQSSYVVTELKPTQKPIVNFFKTNEISILVGEAGTGKDFTCLFYALNQVIQGEFEKIIITKPIVEVGKGMGFLPGDQVDKTSPYKKSFEQLIEKIVGAVEARKLQSKITFEALNFCRGNTFENSCVILSEAQNCTIHELMTFTTRFSTTSKMLINGDVLQADIRNSGLEDFIRIQEGIEGLGVMYLGAEHQLRHPIIIELNKRYRNYLSK